MLNGVKNPKKTPIGSEYSLSYLHAKKHFSPIKLSKYYNLNGSALGLALGEL